MSDQYLQRVIVCEHGEWNPHGIGDEPLLKEDGSINRDNVCRGATHRLVEPDYEAALESLRTMFYPNEYSDGYALEAVTRAVDAAIAGRLLIEPGEET